MIVAHCLRSEATIQAMFGNDAHTFDAYVYNTMSLIPTIMLAPVDELSVGALLCIVGCHYYVGINAKFVGFVLHVWLRKRACDDNIGSSDAANYDC
jgi:hypothetical protein